MNIIEEMLDDIIIKEGGYINHPADKGGPTKYGITLATYSYYKKRKCVANELKLISKEYAKQIYKTLYYYKPKIDQLPFKVQPIIFDIAVNSGPAKAIQMLQQVLDNLGFRTHADGTMGPKTLANTERAIESMGPSFVNAIVNRRKEFYRYIVKNNPNQQVFLKGWLARADSFTQAV